MLYVKITHAEMSVLNSTSDRAEYIVLIDSDNYESKLFFIEECMKL